MTFTLELLHFADQEANAATIDNIDNLSGVLNALRAEDLGDDGMADNTLTLSSGDAIIPGLFFDASAAVFGSAGLADIQIQNELGVQAVALGNHEFDLGTAQLAGLIDGSAAGDFSALSGTALDGLDFGGALFPYLSTNLGFATDANLAPLEVAGGGSPMANTVTSSVIIDVNGEDVAVVGATVPTIRSISSPGEDLGIFPAWASGSPTEAELDALAAIIQDEVDALLAANADLNKVILASHMQQISIEQGLATRLENVDIIIAGGSNTRLFDDDDRVRDGDSNQGEYPQFFTNAGGTTTAVVNTDGNYKYVGRLVIDFDDDGNLLAESYDDAVSGAYATDDQGVTDLGAAGLIDPEIDAITDAIQDQIIATESNVFGVSKVFLNGNRSGTFTADDPDGVRTQETNLGNLTADANLEYAQGFDDTVVVSIKNGGGIRANIGQIVVPAGGTEAERLPNEEILDADGNVVKPEGGISQNDIATTLAFNNGLTLLDITKAELKAFLEGAVSALPDGVSGGFPQLSGLRFAFDETKTAQTYDTDGNIVTPGERVLSAVIVDDKGATIAEIVRDGEIVGDANESFRIVTLNFLANAGDEILSSLSNPNRVDLIDLDADGADDDVFTGAATFAADGTEQDALAEYLNDNHNPDNGGTAFNQPDTGPEDDARIQNVTFRDDDILPPEASEELGFEIVAEFQGDSGDPDDPEGASEVVAHEDGKLYVTNGANDRIDIFTIPDGSSMFQGVNGWNTDVLHTVGETLSSTGALNDLNAPEAGYTPVGIMDGIGATELDAETVRVFVNHELLHFRGNEYKVSDGEGGEFDLLGARISYFDIDKTTREITDSGIAYDTIVNAEGKVATSVEDFQGTPFATFFGGAPGGGSQLAGFSRFCSSVLVEAEQFGAGNGLADKIYFAGEEDGSGFNSIGGGLWALDVETGVIYDVPAVGNGAWENVTEIDTGTTTHVAFILSDDTSPFDTDDFGDGGDAADTDNEAAPLFLYVGEKSGEGFLGRNGLEDGKVYVWVADTPGTDSPAEFNGFGAAEAGSWVEVDNTPDPSKASDDGSTGFDQFGYPTQRTLWERAEAEGAFGFSRPEDVATNPDNGSEFVLASTGVDTFDAGVDTFGTLYTMDVDFTDLSNPTGTLKIIYDGDADETRSLRSPDNLDWADDGYIYVQEDEAEEDTLDGEPLFGNGAVNKNEAGVVRLDPATGDTVRVANIDRSVILDPTTTGTPFDTDAGRAGEWESSGILDVSTLFGEAPGSLFLYDVQAHGIEDQEDVNADSRIEDGDLVEGGQLGFLSTPKSIDLSGLDGYDGVQSVAIKNGVVAVAISREPVDTTIFGETKPVEQPGFVALFDADTQELISRVDVGNLPDQLTFNDDGTSLLVAGEGQFNEDSIDDGIAANPLGTVAIIDVTDPAAPVAEILDFSQFNGFEDAARDAGIRIQEGVSFAEDVEPEYIAVSPDGTTAFVSLQENNAIAKIDLGTNTITDVFSLGTQDFSEVALDPLDDGTINITTFDDLVGFRMADSIASFDVGGKTYVATANEGDSRDFDEDRVFDLAEDGKLDPALLQKLIDDGDLDLSNEDFGLGRLEVSSIDGDTDGDGDIDVIHAFNSRSFSIFDEDGNLVFDSGSDFEQIIASVAPERFNDDDGDDGEDRSDAKGPEPEAITIGEIDGDLYAFIGLERDSGIMIYNVSEPKDASFVNYIPPLHLDNAEAGDVAKHGPEVITFIPADDSTTGRAQIAVSYEISGTTVVYDLLPDLTAIGDIQGAGHVSALVGEEVTTKGIVTAVDFNGYYLQDPEGDGDDATSDAIFVFVGNGNASGISVGDEVKVKGEVSEFIPGGAGTGNLSTTQIVDFGASNSKVLSSGNDLPDAVVIGDAGRTPPDAVVISDTETPVNLQDVPGTFNPDTDGIDFYESLEGMLVTIDNPVVVGATNRFDETWVVADDGANVTSGSADGGLNDRGGLNLNADADGLGDLNPERVQIQYDSFFDLLPDDFSAPDLNIGDDLSDVTGVVSYAFGNFEVLVTEAFEVETPSTNVAETTEIEAGEDRLTVATYNVLNVTSNFDSGDDDDADAAQIDLLAAQIVNNLGAPDILALQEIQDDSGVNFNAEDGVLTAEETLQAVVDAISAAGGPDYEFVSAIVDVEGENGGVPGGNIRNAFLYNPDRVEAKEFQTLESDVLAGMGVTNPNAFDDTRDPLLGVFEFNGQEVTLINNHLTSRFGSTPIFGGPQIFTQAGEDAREQQALTLNEVVDKLLADDPDARVSVLGDLNTFDFTDELTEDLPGVGDEKVLTNLIDQLEGDEAYTFVFQGNSQVLDHIFVTDALLEQAEVDVVHVNNDFFQFASDHEPVVASFLIETPEGEFILGTGKADKLVGTAGADTIISGGGVDMIDAKAGDDWVNSGRNSDMVNGGEGDDVIIGGLGRDALNGDEGDDLIFGGLGKDDLSGGDGEDILVGGFAGDILNGGADNDILIGGRASDTFVFSGDFGDDKVRDYRDGVDDLSFLGADVTLEFAENAKGTLITASGDATGTVMLVGVFDLAEDTFVF